MTAGWHKRISAYVLTVALGAGAAGLAGAYIGQELIDSIKARPAATATLRGGQNAARSPALAVALNAEKPATPASPRPPGAIVAE